MIGVISDSHDNIPAVIKAVELFKRRNVEYVIHLGDVVAPATIPYFKGLTVKLITGNCDGDIAAMKMRLLEIGGEFLGESAEINEGGKNILLMHGKNAALLDTAIKSGKHDYVLHGHTHRQRDEKIGKTRVVNPGALYLAPGQQHSVALIDFENDVVEILGI